MPTLNHFRFWCQSVLPLVYDDSLSYYEVLCKVVNYINNLIDTDKGILDDIDLLKEEIEIIQKWIDTYDYKKIDDVVKKYVDDYIAVGVYFEITKDGYFVAYIPDNWNEIVFNTTGYDIELSIEPEYGHLVLNY